MYGSFVLNGDKVLLLLLAASFELKEGRKEAQHKKRTTNNEKKNFFLFFIIIFRSMLFCCLLFVVDISLYHTSYGSRYHYTSTILPRLCWDMEAGNSSPHICRTEDGLARTPMSTIRTITTGRNGQLKHPRNYPKETLRNRGPVDHSYSLTR